MFSLACLLAKGGEKCKIAERRGTGEDTRENEEEMEEERRSRGSSRIADKREKSRGIETE